MKKLFSIILIAVMVISFAPSVFATDTFDNEVLNEMLDEWLNIDVEMTPEMVAEYVKLVGFGYTSRWGFEYKNTAMDPVFLEAYNDAFDLYYSDKDALYNALGFNHLLDPNFTDAEGNDYYAPFTFPMKDDPYNRGFYIIAPYRILEYMDVNGASDLDYLYLYAKVYWTIKEAVKTAPFECRIKHMLLFRDTTGDVAYCDTEEYLGDVNFDGAVDAKDVLHLKKYIAGSKMMMSFDVADQDGDGDITSRDYRALKTRFVG